MLVKLVPEQISRIWDSIKLSIVAAAPPEMAQEGIEYEGILYSLLSGKMDAWISHGKSKKGGMEPNGIMLTGVTVDQFTGTKNLLIYVYHLWRPARDIVHMSNVDTLKEYARAKGCKKLVAYSENPRIIDIGTKAGFNVDFRVLTLEV